MVYPVPFWRNSGTVVGQGIADFGLRIADWGQRDTAARFFFAFRVVVWFN